MIIYRLSSMQETLIKSQFSVLLINNMTKFSEY